MIDFVDKDVNEMEPIKPLPLEETPFKFVQEVKDLKELVAKLRSVEEFAVIFFSDRLSVYFFNTMSFGRSSKKFDNSIIIM